MADADLGSLDTRKVPTQTGMGGERGLKRRGLSLPICDLHVCGHQLLRMNFMLQLRCFAAFTFPGSHKHIVMLSKINK